MAAKAKPTKPAKAKTSKSPVGKSPVAKPAAAKPAVAKATVAKPTAVPKAIKSPAGAKVKAVKSPARAKVKPAASAAKQTPPVPSDDAMPSEVEVYYVTLDPLPAQLHRARPASGGQAVEYSSFGDAKERLIDHLIELIEEAEHRLHILRRASSHDEYPH